MFPTPSRSLLELLNLGKKRYFLFLAHAQRTLSPYLFALNFICYSYLSGNVINLSSNGTGPFSSVAAQQPSPLCNQRH